MSPQKPQFEVVEDDDAIPEVAALDRADGFAVLDQMGTFRVLFFDPDVRNFVIAAFSALAMIFLVLFQRGSDLGGLLILITGVGGIVLRWSLAPIFVLFIITYFMVFPFGIPGESFDNRWEIEEGRFRIVDVVLTMAILVYVACHYRIYGISRQAIAFEGAARRRGEPVTRRPPALITATELSTLLVVAAGLVIAGQFLWWFVNSVEVAPGEWFPFQWSEEGRTIYRGRRSGVPAGLTLGFNRFVVLIGIAFVGAVLARLIFGYWRLRNMNAAEGAMILLNGNWEETRRERSRLEKWRIWGRKRAKASAKASSDATSPATHTQAGGKP